MRTKIFYADEESNFFDHLNEANYTKIILLTDANTNGFCIPVLRKLMSFFFQVDRIVIPQGEQNKSLEVCSFIWSELEQLGADRSSLLISLGGGVLSDIGGFAASTFKRGIDFAIIPTTLLAMVDACYGGKTAINFGGYKNNIGTFQHPVAIYINPLFLNTLDEKILRSGIAEIIKHALISSPEWWNEMQSYLLQQFLQNEQIKRSLLCKINLIQHDEKDLGTRQMLNLGHTIGHAIESLSLNSTNPLLHGEAIILGLLHELSLSEQLFGLDKNIRKQVKELKDKFFPDLSFDYTFEQLKPFLLHDKKNKAGIRMSLLTSLGDCRIKVLVNEQQIIDSYPQ